MNRITSYPKQLWCAIKYTVREWLEWQDAKAWAKSIHPAWVEIEKRAKNQDTKMKYRYKILKAYRGD